MFDSAPQEMERLIEERFGKPAARLALACFIAIPICTIIGFVVVGATWVKHHVVPRLPGLASAPIQPSSWTDISIALGITLLVVGGGGYFLLNKLKKLRIELAESLGRFLQAAVF